MTFNFSNKTYAIITFAFISAFIFLFFAYHPGLSAPHFSTDDSILINITQIKKAFEIESLRSIFELGHNPDYYPVRDISYMIDQYFWNSDPFAARLHQLVLFFVSSIFLFLILSELRFSIVTALILTMTWLIHPYHAETIMWLSARKDVLAILFALISIYLSLLAFNKNNVFLMWGSFCFFLLTILSKASFTLLPLILIAAIVLKIQKIENKKFYYPIALALILCLISSFGQSWYYSVINNMQRTIPFMDRLFLSITSLGRMTLGWVLPKLNGVDLENHGQWQGLNFNFFYTGLIIWIIALTTTVIALLRKNQKIIYALIILSLLYIPTSGLIFSHNIFYSTRYFEPIGLFLFILFGFWLNQKKTKIIMIITPLVLIFLGFNTIGEGKVWSSNIHIREKALLVTPENTNLQSLLFFDIINDHSSVSTIEEIKHQKETLLKSIESQCSFKEVTTESCRNFYYQAYYLNRWNKRDETAIAYLNMTLKLLEQISPRPRAYERLQVEQMIISNNIDKVVLEKFFSDSRSVLVSEDYRSLFLISGCLLDKPVRALKDTFIRKNLLIEAEFQNYIRENSNTPLLDKIQHCFI